MLTLFQIVNIFVGTCAIIAYNNIEMLQLSTNDFHIILYLHYQSHLQEFRSEMINGLDRKLILALQRDGRASHVELSRQLGVHVSTIAKKMKSLEEQEIIKVRALPNPAKMGYTAHAILAIQADKDKIESVCSSLNSYFNVNLIVTTFGRFDILSTAAFPTWNEMLNFVIEELSKIEGILNFDIYFVRKVMKRSYLPVDDNIIPVKIDETDRQIIEKLTQDGRYTSYHLASELGISLPTCTRRLAFLIQEKVIEVRAVPYMSKIESVANAFMLLKVRQNKFKYVCASLSSSKGVFLLMTLYNSFDIMIGLNADSQEELHRLINNEVLALVGVVSSETIFRGEIKKRYYGGLLVDDGKDETARDQEGDIRKNDKRKI
jgi:DNA-binding Lrp family transcriptional regulator